MCGIKYKIKPTLATYNSSVRVMQERFKKSTNFGQSQWHIKDLYAEQGGERSDPQKGNNTFVQ